jgi:ribosomal-protein-serine acetyltransferase
MFSINIDDVVSLELISYSRAEELYSIISRDREYLAQWLTWPKYISELSDYVGFIKRSLIEYANEETLVFSILYEGKAIGTAGFIDIQKDLEKGEIGYWIDSTYQGKGLATKVSKKLIDLGFEKLMLSKIEASVAVENTKSQKVCERSGMGVEGVLSHVERINGKLLSHKKYSVFKYACSKKL